MKKPILFIVLLFSMFQLIAQNEKPKVALVLSGGGARGIAHIPVLQTLDSLGIVPDLVIGTSMGSIMGGAYAMGYSGDSIAKMTKAMKWDELFGNKVPLYKVSVEEKSEYDKYLIDFEIVDGNFKTSPSLLNDQMLRAFLAELSFPVYNVTNFDDLQIPFRAMTTDIVNGQEMVIGEGAVDVALRASMSIPGIFEPVSYNNTLLVDGGMLNNFPTDVAKQMGADIIIGSDVSGGRKSKEDLDNFGAVLGQAINTVNYRKYDGNKALCDVFIGHEPNITYSTNDFVKGEAIYNQGKIATKESVSALQELANRLQGYQQRSPKLPQVPKEIILDTIAYNGISKDNKTLVTQRIGLKTNTKYQLDDILAGVNRAIGTNVLKKIEFKPIIDGNKRGLELTGHERAKHQIKGSLHYDDYRGVGLIGAYFGRNIIGNGSRFLVVLDIAEQPKAKIQFQQNFGNKRQWWWRLEQLNESLRQNVFVGGNQTDDIKEETSFSSIEFNSNINPLTTYFGAGVNYQYTDMRPRISPDIVNNSLALRSFYANNVKLEAHFNYNNLNTVFYPTRGSAFKVNVSRSLLYDLDLSYSDVNLSTAQFEGKTNDYFKASLMFEKRIAFQNKLTGIIDTAIGFTFEDKVKSDEYSFYDLAYSEFYSLGGTMRTSRRNNYTFRGLYENEVFANQFIMLNFGLQYSPLNNIYITPNVNLATFGLGPFKNYIKKAFTPKGNWQDAETTSLVLSAGASVGYKSLLGPINLGASWTNDINKVRFFFNVGIPLYR